MITAHRRRAAISLAVLFVLYQSAQGIGDMWLHSFAVQATLMSACVLAAWPLSRWIGYRGCNAYALEPTWRALAWLIGGLLLAGLGKVAALTVGWHAGIYVPVAVASPWPSVALGAVPMLLLSTFVPSLAEDIITRGFWYRAAGIRWRHGLAFVAASAALYVLNHIYRLERGPLEWLMLFCFGLAYATALWRSGSLWAAVGLHWGWNFTNAVLPVDTVDAQLGATLSIGVHLLLVVLLLLVPMRGTRRAWAIDARDRRG